MYLVYYILSYYLYFLFIYLYLSFQLTYHTSILSTSIHSTCLSTSYLYCLSNYLTIHPHILLYFHTISINISYIHSLCSLFYFSYQHLTSFTHFIRLTYSRINIIYLFNFSTSILSFINISSLHSLCSFLFIVFSINNICSTHSVRYTTIRINIILLISISSTSILSINYLIFHSLRSFHIFHVSITFTFTRFAPLSIIHLNTSCLPTISSAYLLYHPYQYRLSIIYIHSLRSFTYILLTYSIFLSNTLITSTSITYYILFNYSYYF